MPQRPNHLLIHHLPGLGRDGVEAEIANLAEPVREALMTGRWTRLVVRLNARSRLGARAARARLPGGKKLPRSALARLDLWLGAAWHGLGRGRLAALHLRGALRSGQLSGADRAAARLLMADFPLARGRWRRVHGLLDAALDEAKGDALATALVLAGRAGLKERREGFGARSERSWIRALAHAGKAGEAGLAAAIRHRLVRGYLAAGRSDDASRVAFELVSARDGRGAAGALAELGAALAEAGEENAGAELLRAAADHAPWGREASLALNHLAALALRRGELEEARGWVEACTGLLDGNAGTAERARVLCLEAELAVAGGRLREARELLDRLPRAPRRWPLFRAAVAYYRARLARAEGRPSEALAETDRGLRSPGLAARSSLERSLGLLRVRLLLESGHAENARRELARIANETLPPQDRIITLELEAVLEAGTDRSNALLDEAEGLARRLGGRGRLERIAAARAAAERVREQAPPSLADEGAWKDAARAVLERLARGEAPERLAREAARLLRPSD